VVFNGEIYNYQELIPELQALGHVFHTRSDTEVIVHAWEAWGEECVRRFRGMFAFALWDRNRETLFLARDRLAVKPLYYALLPDGTLSSAPSSSRCWRMADWHATSIPWRSRNTSRSATWPSRGRSFVRPESCRRPTP
jgi:asparagine synthetase B (glutamine-hydrolysing)